MKTITTLVLVILGLLGSVRPTQANSFTFTTIDVPGAKTTRAFGINDAGQIVGESGAIKHKLWGSTDRHDKRIQCGNPHNSGTMGFPERTLE